MNIFGFRQRLALSVLLVTAFAATSKADNFAYTALSSGEFGTMDLTTAQFTPLGNSGLTLTGLAVIGGTVYGAPYGGDTLYTVNPANGSLTAVGTGGISYWLFGSTTSGLYGLTSSQNLYSINPATGASTLIGSTGISNAGGYYYLSADSPTLYETNGTSLYWINPTTGAGTLIGSTGDTEGIVVPEGGVLYDAVLAGAEAGQLGTLDPTTGAYTDGPDITGAGNQVWALAPESSSSSSATPEPSSFWLMGSGLVGLAGMVRRRLGQRG